MYYFIVLSLYLVSIGITSAANDPFCRSGEIYFGNLNETYPQFLHMVGTYKIQPNSYKGYNVYKHTDRNEFIYHEDGRAGSNGFWLAGPQIGNRRQAVFSIRSNSRSPALTFNPWRQRAGDRSWIRLNGLRSTCADQKHDICSSGLVEVVGLNERSRQAVVLGEYKLTGGTQNLRPVYKQERGNHYIFYKFGFWIIGDVLGMPSGRVLNADAALRPEVTVSPWQVLLPSGFVQTDFFRVKCVGVKPHDPAHPCDGHVCENGGKCVPRSGEAVCLCPSPFFGEKCEYNKSCGDPAQLMNTEVETPTGKGPFNLAFYRCPGATNRKAIAVCNGNRKWKIVVPC